MKNAELWTEELVLIEIISRLYEKRCAFFSRELWLRKQLGFLNKKEKKMFARELASIEDLERSEQEVPGGVGLSDVVKAPELMVNPFDNLLDLFSRSVLVSFVDSSKSSGPPLN